MKKFNIQWIAETAIIAALYAALTWLLAPISYGSMQFSISEVLILLVIFKPSYSVALILGCFIANTTSSLGWWDMVFGTLATAIAVIPMIKIKKIWLSALFPVISNGIIIAIELYFSLDIKPIWLSGITVALGEAVVLYFIGIPVMISISKIDGIVELLHLDVSHLSTKSFLTFIEALAIAISCLGVILFIAYPLYNIVEIGIEDGKEVAQTSSFSALTMCKNHLWALLFPLFSVGYGISFLFAKRKVKLCLTIANALFLLIPFILVGCYYSFAISYPYYYGYLIYIVLLLGIGVLGYSKDKPLKNNLEGNEIY